MKSSRKKTTHSKYKSYAVWTWLRPRGRLHKQVIQNHFCYTKWHRHIAKGIGFVVEKKKNDLYIAFCSWSCHVFSVHMAYFPHTWVFKKERAGGTCASLNHNTSCVDELFLHHTQSSASCCFLMWTAVASQRYMCWSSRRAVRISPSLKIKDPRSWRSSENKKKKIFHSPSHICFVDQTAWGFDVEERVVNEMLCM